MRQSKILVVEDDDSIRLPLIDTLREQAHVEVDGARDGVEALHQVSTTRYALVVLDVVMPHMTGIDFLDSLQAMASDPSVKGMDQLPAVIIVTGASPEDVPNSAIEERFPFLVRRVLRKPVDITELTRCVRAIVG
jgi:CheY-like chemotaxis protein